ncbi:unnamed protein product [Cylicocyclus nassatus]|uniref:Uncharacterized protein n=1 Tax=Cylicocyclus nassatus TaxID=53992 RepID=A0AA36H494_CYLNA|nr:unnamed protein product [Cylicocyclus nassatus]
MGSSMAKSKRCEYVDHWHRPSKDIGSHFSKEYAEYWRRPAAEKGAEFSMIKNEYSYISGSYGSSGANSNRYSTFASSR